VDLKKPVWVSCAVLALCLSAHASLAQQEPQRRGGRAGAGGGQALTPVELERWFDSYVLIQAQEAVKVTDAQFPRFLQRLRALQAARRQNAVARRQILNAMGRLVNATPVDESAMRDQLKALRDLDARSADDMRRAYEALDEVLDPAQQARFRLFEQAVERRQIELLMKARERAGEAARRGQATIK
jgi:Spy/CpxP family protein refolding chaperone